MRLLLYLILTPTLAAAQALVNSDGTLNLVNFDSTKTSVGAHLVYQNRETGLVYTPSGKAYKLSGKAYCANIRFPEKPSGYPIIEIHETFPGCLLLEVKQ